MIFAASQIKAIRSQKMTAVLVPVSERVRAGRVRVLRRWALPVLPAPPAMRGRPAEVLTFIEARLDLVEEIEIVVASLPGEEPVPALITITAVCDMWLDELTLTDAWHCGARTTAEMIAAWVGKHPRTRRVRLVTFELGDTRTDLPLLIGRGWPDYTHDPSRAMFAEPEPVSPGEHARQAAGAQQRYLRLQADRASELAQSSASERLAAIQRGTVAQGDVGA
jgi:hypothetical protein